METRALSEVVEPNNEFGKEIICGYVRLEKKCEQNCGKWNQFG